MKLAELGHLALHLRELLRRVTWGHGTRWGVDVVLSPFVSEFIEILHILRKFSW